MQKFLRTLMLMAVMLLPFASHAQSTVSSFPYTCGFETTDDATAWVFTNSANANHWIIGTAADAVSSGSQALYISNDNSSYAYSNSSNAGFCYATLTFEITSAVEVGVSFDWKCNGESTWDFLRAWIAPGVFTPTVGQNPTGATDRYQTGNPEGWYQIGSTLLNLSTGWNTASLNQSLAAGTYTVVLMWYNDGSGGSQPPAAIDNFTITASSCYSPTNLVASNITATSATLTWNGTATDYTLYEYANLDSAAYMYTTTTADLNTLEPNTVYTFGVTSDCGNEESAMTIVTFRTGCAAMSLPYTTSFEAIDLVATTPNADALPFCWSRYASGTGSYTYFPYSYSSSTYKHTGSRLLYFYDGTSTSYPDTMVAILPEVDVATYPMNSNRLTFWGRVSSGSNVKNVQIGTMTDPTDMSTFALVETVAVSGTTHTLYSVPLTNASATAPYLAIMLVKSASGYLCIDDLTLEEMPSCLEISNLAAGNITSSSVELTWSDAANASATYTVYNMADTSVVATGVAGTTYTVTDLTANTQYTFGVAANCATGDASVMTVSTRTACAAMSLPYTTGFEADGLVATTPNADALPFCWSRYASGTGSYTYYPYSYSSSTYAHDGSSRVLYFYDGTSTSYPDTMVAILPEVDVAAYPMNSNRLTFWGRVSSGSNVKNVQVGTMTDPTDMSTFAPVETVAVSGTTHTLYSVPLTNASATAPYVAIMLVKSSSGYLCIDDLTLEELPSCVEVSGLTITGKTTTSVTLEWADALNPTATYTVYNMADTSVVATGINALTYTVTGLTANTNYVFGVQANRSATDASGIVTIDAYTGYCTPNPTSVDGSGITTVALGNITSAIHPSSAPYYIDNTDMIGNVPAGTTCTVGIEYSTGYTYGTIIWVDWNNNLTFDADEVVYRGTSTSTNPTILNATFDIPATTPTGAYRLRIAGADSFFDSYVSNPSSTPNPCFTSTYAVAEDYTLYVLAPPSCPAVTGLTVSNITSMGATLTWNASADAENGYWYFDAASPATTMFTTDTNIADLTNQLEPNTEYTFGVIARCWTEQSDTTFVTFRTLCAPVMLPYTETFGATSEYRDCWNLVSMNTGNDLGTSNGMGFVTVNGRETLRFSSYSNHGGSNDYNQYGYTPVLANYYTDVADSLHVKVVYATYNASNSLYFGYIAGNDTVWNPNAYTTTGSSDWQTLEANLPLTATQLAVRYYGNYSYYAWIDSVEVTVHIPCDAPVVTVDTVTSNSATISWTGTGLTYQYVAADNENVYMGDATTTTYTFTGLQPSTTYTYGVFAGCGYGATSDIVPVTFTTAAVDTTGGDTTVVVNDSVHITYAVNDATMGTTNPAPGTYTYVEGEAFSVTAVPATGYHLADWQMALNIPDYGPYTEMLGTDTLTFGDTVYAMYEGMVLTAIFAADGGDTTVVECDPVTIPFVETFETTSATADCWTSDGDESWTITTGDYSTSTGAFEGTLNAMASASNYTSVSKFISPVLSGVTNGLQLQFAHIQRSWYGDVDALTVYYRTASDAAWQQLAAYTNEVATWTVETINIPGIVYQVAFEFTSGYGYGVGLDSIAFNLPPACMPVVNLTASNITATGATLSWTGSAASYNVYAIVDSVATLVQNVTVDSIDLTGLTAMTAYTYGVRAVCGTDESEITTVTFATACGGETCMIEINGADSYGDGWNGNAIQVMPAGNVIATFTIASGNSASAQIPVCSGYPVSFAWVSGDYPGETSFEIKDGGGMVVYTAASGSSLTNGEVFYTLTDACPSCLPAAITVDTATTTSVTISWTGTAASYDVYNGETFVANVTTNTYTFTGLNPASTYTFGVQAICSATDTANLATVAVMTACADITTLPYMEGFENGLGCWSTVNGSADGMPWYAMNQAEYAHTGASLAVSFSYYSGAMHADAWLISPKFVLPTVNAGDTLNFSWWYRVDGGYPLDLYDVMLSTTTDDTTAFTTTLLAVIPDSTNGEYTQMVVDLTAYAGQSIYLAFHHHDSYDQDFLMIDDIALSMGAAPVPPADTLTVTFAVNDATMGTTIPAPGTYQYLSGDTLSFSAMPNTGYIFNGWVIAYGDGSVDSLPVDYISASAPADMFMNYSPMTITALFGTVDPNSDSMQVNVAVNDPTMGTTIPAPGTHYFHVGEAASVVAVPNDGYHLTGWTVNVVSEGVTYVDTTYNYAIDDVFDLFGGWVVSESNAVFTWTVTANFAAGEPPVMHDSVTVNVSVNNETMGVVTPAPGTHYYVLGDTVIMSIMPNPGYRVVSVQMSATHPIMGTLFDETITDSLELAELVGVNDTLIVDDEEMYGMVVNINVIFAAEGTEPTTYSVEVAYDQTKGTVTGAGDYVEGSNVRLVAMPATHYEFYAWLDNTTGDTVGRESVYAIANIDRDYFLTAIFVASTGIDDVDMDNVTIYSTDNVIVVRGAEGKQVTLFDVNGRMLSREARAAENVEFRVNNSGVYLVKVANAAAKRVVVIR